MPPAPVLGGPVGPPRSAAARRDCPTADCPTARLPDCPSLASPRGTAPDSSPQVDAPGTEGGFPETETLHAPRVQRLSLRHSACRSSARGLPCRCSAQESPSTPTHRHGQEAGMAAQPVLLPIPPAAGELATLAQLPGVIQRVRRIADLSQRELARALNVSPGLVGDIEAGRRVIGLGLLLDALALADLHLVIADDAGGPVGGMSSAGARDAGGRRFPAHLDVAPSDGRWPSHFGAGPRRSRGIPTVQVPQRQRRDALRAVHGVPADHATRQEIDAAVSARRPQPPVRTAAGIGSDWSCDCRPECVLEGLCVATCTCQCDYLPQQVLGVQLPSAPGRVREHVPGPRAGPTAPSRPAG